MGWIEDKNKTRDIVGKLVRENSDQGGISFYGLVTGVKVILGLSRSDAEQAVRSVAHIGSREYKVTDDRKLVDK